MASSSNTLNLRIVFGVFSLLMFLALLVVVLVPRGAFDGITGNPELVTQAYSALLLALCTYAVGGLLYAFLVGLGDLGARGLAYAFAGGVAMAGILVGVRMVSDRPFIIGDPFILFFLGVIIVIAFGVIAAVMMALKARALLREDRYAG